MTAAACLRGTTCHCAETDHCVWSRPMCRQESDMKRARLLTELGPRIRREGGGRATARVHDEQSNR